jgi:hypothetical protein
MPRPATIGRGIRVLAVLGQPFVDYAPVFHKI